METDKKQWHERLVSRALLSIFSLIFISGGIILLFAPEPNYFMSIIFVGMGATYLWSEIQIIKNPKTLEEEQTAQLEITTSYGNEMSFWWQRLIGFIIDLSFCFLLLMLLVITFNLSPASSNLFFLLIIFIYYFIAEEVTGKTIGKIIFRLRVIDSKINKKPSTSKIFIRTLCRFIPFEGLSFIAKKPYGWHDSFSGTMVVKMKAIEDILNEEDRV